MSESWINRSPIRIWNCPYIDLFNHALLASFLICRVGYASESSLRNWPLLDQLTIIVALKKLNMTLWEWENDRMHQIRRRRYLRHSAVTVYCTPQKTYKSRPRFSGSSAILHWTDINRSWAWELENFVFFTESTKGNGDKRVLRSWRQQLSASVKSSAA